MNSVTAGIIATGLSEAEGRIQGVTKTAALLLLAALALPFGAPPACAAACPEEAGDGCLAVCLACGTCAPPSLVGAFRPALIELAPAERPSTARAFSALIGPPSEILHVPRPPSGS